MTMTPDRETEALAELTLALTPGGLLAAARLRAGMSLEQVSKRSRVPLPALEAIEGDDWDALPAMVYVRGFLRLYAREVGLEPAAVIEALDATLAAHDRAEETAHRRAESAFRSERVNRLRTRVAYAVVVSVLIAGVLLAFFSVAPQQLEARPVDDAAPAAAPSEP